MAFFSLFTSSTNSFRNQQADEKTIAVIQKHWIVLFWPMVFLILFAFLPFGIDAYLAGFSWYPDFANLFWFLTTALFLILWIALFGNLMIYSLNTVIVTDKRVIDNQQKGLFQHQMNEMRLDRIQDITVKIQGVFANLLNYGDVQIQSAGAQNEFYFSTLPDPESIKKIISDLR